MMTAKQLAEHVLLTHTEDIEMLAVAEMVWDSLVEDDGEVGLTQVEFEELTQRVYELVQGATIIVSFRDGL